jgi:hypothetical protein
MDDRCTPVFIIERDDEASHQAALELGHIEVIFNQRSRSYAGAINTAIEMHRSHKQPFWYFFGADDLLFHDGWLDQMFDLIPQFDVIGTNDLGNPEVMSGIHSTHSLVSKKYAENGCVTQPGFPLCEEYEHNWCDTEFIETAKSRNAFAPCLASVVEHRHWAWHKAKMDATYEKGLRTEAKDRALFQERRHLWSGI